MKKLDFKLILTSLFYLIILAVDYIGLSKSIDEWAQFLGELPVGSAVSSLFVAMWYMTIYYLVPLSLALYWVYRERFLRRRERASREMKERSIDRIMLFLGILILLSGFSLLLTAQSELSILDEVRQNWSISPPHPEKRAYVLKIYERGEQMKMASLFSMVAGLALFCSGIAKGARIRTESILKIMVGGFSIYVSNFINLLAGFWLYEPFLFPVSFVVAAIFGWWSKNKPWGFMVGFLSIPFMISLSRPYFAPFLLICNLVLDYRYDLGYIGFLLTLGIVSGFIGVGAAHWSTRRSTRAHSTQIERIDQGTEA